MLDLNYDLNSAVMQLLLTGYYKIIIIIGNHSQMKR